MPNDLPYTLFQTLVLQGVIGEFQNVSELSGGRTNHLWRFHDGAGLRVLKLFAKTATPPLFPNDPDAEQLILKALTGTGLAPELQGAGSSAQGRWILYSYLPGHSWQRDARCVGAALRQVHHLPAVSGLRIAPNGSAALIAQTRGILNDCHGSMASELKAIQPPDPGVPPTQPKVIHSDPVPANILVSGRTLTFIDWQCPALGDPCDDLGIFLSPAMHFIYRGDPLNPSEREHLFAGYGDPDIQARYEALAPLFHWRMAAHCLWRAERGAPGYAKALELERTALLELL